MTLVVACLRNLQAVADWNVPLHALPDGVWASEELLAILLAVSGLVGIHVLIKEFPHVVGKVEDLEVLGVLESRLELLGDGSVVLWLPHDFADEPLLAVEVIVVELLVQVLEHGDPLDNVERVGEVTILSRPILRVSLLVILVVLAIGSAIIIAPVVSGAGAEEAAGKDKVTDDTEEDKGSEQAQGGSGA